MGNRRKFFKDLAVIGASAIAAPAMFGMDNNAKNAATTHGSDTDNWLVKKTTD